MLKEHQPAARSEDAERLPTKAGLVGDAHHDAVGDPRTKLASGSGNAVALPSNIRTRSVMPHAAFSSRAASQNAAVISTPVTVQPYLAAIQRAGPPIPLPISRIVSPAYGSSGATSSCVAATPGR